jgi:putative hemolysin
MIQVLLSEALIILGLLVLNGVFAMSEIAVVTSRRARLERLAERGRIGARQALRLIDDPTRFLSTVQIGITLIGVLAGAFGGATIARELDARLERIPALAPVSEALALGVVVALVSFCSLVIGELVPKRIAMQMPERIAAMVAIPMHLLSRLAAPLVAVLTVTTRTILRLLRVPETKGTPVTEDEIRAVIAEGRQSGAVQIAEHEMLEGVFRLGDRYVRDLMLPRPDLVWLDVADDARELAAIVRDARVHTVLVCDGSVDEVVGVLRPHLVLMEALAGRPIQLAKLVEEPLFVPGAMAVTRLLETFRDSRERFAVVLDEFGGVEGAITLDRLIEEVVGEVPDRSTVPSDAPMTRRADGSWLVDASLDAVEALSALGLPPPADRERGGYRTVAGFVMSRLGHVPHVAEGFEYHGARFEVVDMDQRRVDKVLVTLRTPPR